VHRTREDRAAPAAAQWLEGSYLSTLDGLARQGTREIRASEDPALLQSVLAGIAWPRGLREQGEPLPAYAEVELEETPALPFTTLYIEFEQPVSNAPPQLRSRAF
jgi:hypothetical protein